jgi:hypothetical protein
MAYRFTNSSLVHHVNKIQAIADKFEADLVASGRFKYLKTEGNKKIYVEKATGREVPVIIPLLAKKQITS